MRLRRYPNVLMLLAWRVGPAVAIVAGPTRWTLAPPLLLGIYVTTFLVDVRSRYGHDGADQLAGYIMLGVGISGIASTPLARTACVLFFAFQGCLAYATAGWSERVAGARVARRDVSRGSAHGADLRQPACRPISRRASDAVEIREPRVARLGVLIPARHRCASVLYTVLALGATFHVTNAVLMGLNCFVWSFFAVYPLLLWVIQHRGW